jgi:hypothetical protein
MASRFKHGDLVKVADDLGEWMAHFQKGCEAIVDYSFADKFGYGDEESYGIFIKGSGTTSWYPGSVLTFIRHAPELLKEWNEERDKDTKQKSDIKWIHENWQKVKSKSSSVTALACMEFIGFETSFHRNGEYFILFEDWRMLLPYIDRLMTAKNEDDLKGPDGEVSQLSSDLFRKLQSKIK